MDQDKDIKNLIKNDYLTIKNGPKNKKLDTKILRKIKIKKSIKTVVIILVSLIGAALFSYSLALLLKY